MIVVWEAADRICGKRLKALMPTLVDAMERHGHLQLEETVRGLLLRMSAATIDRRLKVVRGEAFGTRRQKRPLNRVRRLVAVRTFADWDDVRPGFMEVDLVTHSGPTKNSLQGKCGPSFFHKNLSVSLFRQIPSLAGARDGTGAALRPAPAHLGVLRIGN